MDNWIFCRIGDHYEALPGEAWKDHGRLYRLLYRELLGFEVVMENPEVEVDAPE